MPGKITVNHVSKAYRLGQTNRSLRESIAGLARMLVSAPSDNVDRQHWALKDVSFDVNTGEALGLIGPNGSGKTTILKLLSRITYPTAGSLHVEGRLSSLIELGAGFHPDLTGRENIYLNATILGLRRREVDRRLDEIIQFSGIETYIDTPVKRYSSGMYVRLGFSIAAHIEPDVLLVDEVLAVGDAMFRQRCAKRIKALRQLGTTIVFVSHNMPLVRSVCDQAVLLIDGSIQARGDVISVVNAFDRSMYTTQALQAGNWSSQKSELDGDSQVRITNVMVRKIGGNGREVGHFSYAEPMEIITHYATKTPVRNAHLVLRIVRSDGLTCSMVRTQDYGYTFDNVVSTGAISVIIERLQLSSGSYNVDARLLGEVDGLPLAQYHSGWFRVLGQSPGHGEDGGIFTPLVRRVSLTDADHFVMGQPCQEVADRAI